MFSQVQFHKCKRMENSIYLNLNYTNTSEFYLADDSYEFGNLQSALQRMRGMFILFYTPLLLLTGLIGNSFLVFIFLKTKLNKISSSFFIAALGISDSLILIVLFFEWFDTFDHKILTQSFICHPLTYINRTAHFLSVWLFVAFTVERFLVVVFARRQSNRKSRQVKRIQE